MYLEAVTETVCNSIILDYTSTSVQTTKCKFISGNPNRCETQQKKCDNFKVEDYIDLCYDISLLSPGKKCVYSNSACNEISRSCLELSAVPVTEEMCEAAPTSDTNSKVCKLKSDGTGCEEVEKVEQESENKGTTVGICNRSLMFNLLFVIFGLLL